MSVAITLTSQQCKRARALLKWNVQDLAGHTRLSVRIIDQFERNKSKLLRPENEEIVSVFIKQGIDFQKSGTVALKKGGTQSNTTSAQEHVVYEIDHTLGITGQHADAGDANASPKKPQHNPRIIDA